MPAHTAPPAGEDREVFRLAAPVVLWWVWLAFVAANVIDFAVQGVSSPRFGAVVSAILLFVTGLMYTLALRPRVVTGSAGLTVLNPFRTHRIPWPLIQSVDTGEWVRVHYRRTAGPSPGGAEPGGAEPGGAEPGEEEPGSHDTAILHCWALYVSASARRKIARGAPRQRPRAPLYGARFGRVAEKVESGFASPASSRLPDEARHLASLPVASAMASRLDTRAARERQLARKAPQGREQATASWPLPALAAAVVPALILLIVALA